MGSAHSLFCHCDMCMKSSKLSLQEQQKHAAGLSATMVDRKDPDDVPDGDPLMRSEEVHAIIKADSMVNMLEMMRHESIFQN